MSKYRMAKATKSAITKRYPPYIIETMITTTAKISRPNQPMDKLFPLRTRLDEAPHLGQFGFKFIPITKIR